MRPRGLEIMVRILTGRPQIVFAVLALAAAACTGAPAPAPVDLLQRFEGAGLPFVDVHLTIQPEHRRTEQRYVGAAMATLKDVGEWLGPFPAQSLTIVDPPWAGSSNRIAADAVVLERTPWWSTPTSMTAELATARAVGRRFWVALVDTRALPSWFVDGLVEYTARRVVTPLFQGVNLWPGYAMLEQRYFGGFVPRFVRLRLLPELDGGPLEAYRARPRVDAAAPASPEDRRSLAGKAVLTLNTLERWVGRPVFDDALTEFVRTSRGSQPTLSDFARVASAVSSQDLSWFFEQTLAGSAVFDYSVAELTSDALAPDRFETTVVASRLGDGLFTGTSAPRVGPFERGRGVTLLVTFADGQRVIDRWDGRDARKTFRYSSPSRAVSATIDPDRTLVLDLHQMNNSRTIAPMNGAIATRWSARWMVWLEDLLLTYGALV